MEFNSVKDYFYKLNNRGYQLMMLPLITFALFYSQPVFNLPELVLLNQENSSILFFVAGVFTLVALTIVQIRTKNQARAIAKEVGLGIKLERLGTVLTRKMVAISLTILFISMALFFTGDSYFAIAFAILFFWYFMQWPTPGRVCRLLNLRGDEHQMVITRGEAFK